MRLFIRHILKSGSSDEEKRNQVSIRKDPEKKYGLVVKVVILQLNIPGSIPSRLFFSQTCSLYDIKESKLCHH